jgi:hypothetical protein
MPYAILNMASDYTAKNTINRANGLLEVHLEFSCAAWLFSKQFVTVDGAGSCSDRSLQPPALRQARKTSWA